jgi:hypothetical protein
VAASWRSSNTAGEQEGHRTPFASWPCGRSTTNNAIVTTFTTLTENFEAQSEDVLPYLLTLEPT